MDADLVEHAKRGDPPARDRLLRLLTPRLYKLARRLVRDENTAEDLVSETLYRGMKRLRKLHEPAAAGAWFARILVNLWRDEMRREARKGAPLVDVEPDLEPSNIPQPIDTAIATEIEDRVSRALASLPPIQRAVVSLRLEGLDTREIAALLDSTTDRVKSNLYHARARLRVLLADLLGPDPRDELDPDPTPNHGSSP